MKPCEYDNYCNNHTEKICKKPGNNLFLSLTFCFYMALITQRDTMRCNNLHLCKITNYINYIKLYSVAQKPGITEA